MELNIQDILMEYSALAQENLLLKLKSKALERKVEELSSNKGGADDGRNEDNWETLRKSRN